MLKLDKVFQKIGTEFVELSLTEWMKSSNLVGSTYQNVYHTDVDMSSGGSIELPAGMYNPDNDIIFINQEGFMLIPNYQYTISGDTITFLTDIPANTNVHIIIIKLGKGSDDKVSFAGQGSGEGEGGGGGGNNPDDPSKECNVKEVQSISPNTDYELRNSNATVYYISYDYNSSAVIPIDTTGYRYNGYTYVGEKLRQGETRLAFFAIPSERDNLCKDDFMCCDSSEDSYDVSRYSSQCDFSVTKVKSYNSNRYLYFIQAFSQKRDIGLFMKSVNEPLYAKISFMDFGKTYDQKSAVYGDVNGCPNLIDNMQFAFYTQKANKIFSFKTSDSAGVALMYFSTCGHKINEIHGEVPDLYSESSQSKFNDFVNDVMKENDGRNIPYDVKNKGCFLRINAQEISHVKLMVKEEGVDCLFFSLNKLK